MPDSLPDIKTCRSCNSRKLKLVLDLGDLALSDFTKKPVKSNKKYPLTLLLCLDCHLVQLKNSVPPQKLYTERYGYRSGINNTMRVELESIVKKASKKANLKKGELVIDVGANDGTLLHFYPKNVKRMGVEPVKKFSEDILKNADFLVSNYFTQKNIVKKYPKISKAKIITAISMFYDLEDPNSFLKDVSSMLDRDGIFVIQQNYLLSMLRVNAFDNIVHEHIEYYSLYSLEKLLERNELKVIDVELSDINGGSFRTYIAHKNSKYKVSKNVKTLREKERRYKLDKKQPYIEFAKRVKAIKKELKKYIETQVKLNKRVYLYGASTRGNTILQYVGLDHKLISKAVERNPEKWGKFIASVGIPIISEEQARREMPENMLVLPWFFKTEFLKREKDYLNRGGRLIFPLPRFQVIKKKSKS